MLSALSARTSSYLSSLSLSLVAAFALAGGPVTAQTASDTGAQVATPSKDDEARSAFREGTEAAETERWSDSERAFRRAYELSHAPSALFNQAVALRALGRHVEARDAFDQVLDSKDPNISDDLRSSAREMRSESAARVAVLSLTGLTLSPHRIRVDGRPLADSLSRPLTIELDEGAHSVELTYSGNVWSASLELLPAEQRSLHVVFGSTKRADSSKDSGARGRRRKLWGFVGGAILLGAFAATTTFLLVQRDSEERLAPRARTVFEVP